MRERVLKFEELYFLMQFLVMSVLVGCQGLIVVSGRLISGKKADAEQQLDGSNVFQVRFPTLTMGTLAQLFSQRGPR